MYKSTLLSAVLLGGAVLAQSPCATVSGAQRTLSSSHHTEYYTFTGQNSSNTTGATSFLFDLTCTGNLTLDAVDLLMYDGLNQSTNANLVGLSPTCFIYTCPTTWVGNELNQLAWTQYPATCTIQASSTATPVTANTPILLTPGTYGIMVEVQAIQGISSTANGVTTPYAPVHPLFQLDPNGGVPFTYADPFMTVANQALQTNSWISTPWIASAPDWMDVWHNLRYTPPAGAAIYSKFGTGCAIDYRSYYQAWTGGPFAFSNSTLTMVQIGNQYAVGVTQAPPNWFTPTSTSLASASTTPQWGYWTYRPWDDAISNTIALPWTFNYPGGSTTQIEINSNGLVTLGHDPTTNPGFPYSTPANWMAKPASFAICYGNFDCSNAGTWPPANGYGIWYDVDPSGNAVYVTWKTQEFSTNALPGQTFQLMLDVNGMVEYRYQTINMTYPTSKILVGWTPGAGQPVPPAVDMTVTPGFLCPLSLDGADNTDMTILDRPILGTSIDVDVKHIRTGALAGIMVISFGALPVPGVPLDAFGMPTCSLYVPTFDIQNVFMTPTPDVTVTLPVPVSSMLSGLQFGMQSFIYVPVGTPGMNAAGFLSSNGGCVTLSAF